MVIKHLLTGLILQVSLTSTIIATEVAMDAQNSPFLGVMQSYIPVEFEDIKEVPGKLDMDGC